MELPHQPLPQPPPLPPAPLPPPLPALRDANGCVASPALRNRERARQTGEAAWSEADRQSAIKCLSNRTVWFLGNSVSRHWAFTLAGLLAEGQTGPVKMKPIMYENEKQVGLHFSHGDFRCVFALLLSVLAHSVFALLLLAEVRARWRVQGQAPGRRQDWARGPREGLLGSLRVQLRLRPRVERARAGQQRRFRSTWGGVVVFFASYF